MAIADDRGSLAAVCKQNWGRGVWVRQGRWVSLTGVLAQVVLVMGNGTFPCKRGRHGAMYVQTAGR